MGDCQALYESTEIAVLFRPEYEMSVIGHQAVTQQPHFAIFRRLHNDPLESQVIIVAETSYCRTTPRLSLR